MTGTRQIVAILVITILLCSVLTSGAPVDDDTSVSDYSPAELEAAIRAVLLDVPEKRRMCRPGMTYQPITRQCLPSLGSLKGRGRGRYRG